MRYTQSRWSDGPSRGAIFVALSMCDSNLLRLNADASLDNYNWEGDSSLLIVHPTSSRLRCHFSFCNCGSNHSTRDSRKYAETESQTETEILLV